MERVEPADGKPMPALPHLPIWVASLLVQAGSFAIVLGLGVVVLSLAYGTGSTVLGGALVAGGYAAVGFPAWYLNRLPVHRATVSRLTTRLRQSGP